MDLVVGTGQMAKEYCKAIKRLGREILVLGNSEASSLKFQNESGIKALPGSFEKNFSLLESKVFEDAYVAVNEHQIAACLIQLNQLKNVGKIFVEKPGASSPEEIRSLSQLVTKDKFFISYNRRFYSSVSKLIELIEIEGGITGCHFDFSEATDRILSFNFPKERLAHWLFLNSTHVIDLVFFLIGHPKKMTCKNIGEKTWHGSGDHFYGVGESEMGIPFTYHSDWGCPGRWGVEVTTKESKYFLRPLEELHCQRKGTFTVEQISLEKPEGIKEGIFEIVKNASEGNLAKFVSLSDQAQKSTFYDIIKFGGEV